MFDFCKHHIKATMRKRIFARITAGLLCGALFFTDAASMGVRAAASDADAEQPVALTESDNEDVTNDSSVDDEEKEAKKEETTEEKAEETSGEEKSEEETTGSESTEEGETEGADEKEENPGTETEQPEEPPKEEEPSEEELPKEDIPQEEQTEESGEEPEETEEKTENPGQTEDVPEGEDAAVEESVSENATAEIDAVADSVVMADGDIASGSYGNITWVIDANGKLTVRGSGEFSALDVRNPETRAPWFDYKDSIISAVVHVNGMTDASYMFYSCSKLTSLDLFGFETKNVTSMKGMFGYCRSLPELNVSGFNTANVTDMSGMFESCFALEKLNLKNFNTSKVTQMSSMFASCHTLSDLDVGRFDTKNVQSMSQMFRFCSSLTELDLSNFDTSNVTDMWCMFDGCHDLTKINVNNFNTAKVTDITGIFANCINLTELDLSNFDVGNAMGYEILEGGDEPLAYSTSLTTIYTPYNLSYSIPLPVHNETDKWYRSDGTVVTELPQNLSYSIALGKNYIPTEKKPDESEEESFSDKEKFIRNVTNFSLANADEQTKNSIQKALYDLLFRAHFAPQGQDPGKTVTFPGTSELNRKWPYQNGIAAGRTVNDPRLGTIKYAKKSAGCLSYARFASQYVYGHIAEATYIRDMSVANVKKQIQEHVDPGEIIGFSNCIHFVAFLGESEDEKGFYCISYGGGGNHPEDIYHRIEVVYFTYDEFVKKYTNFNGKKADAFLYYDTTGGSFRSQTGNTIANPASAKVELDCPGTAVIEQNEEKLDSRAPGTAGFGSVTQNGEQITFDLTYSPNYNLSIFGTGEGIMTVTLTYYDEAGNLINQRKFVNIPVTAATEVESGGFDHIADFVLYVSEENEEMNAWGAGPGETVYAPDDTFLPESSFEYAVDDESGVHYKDIPDSGEIPQGLWISTIPDYTYTGTAIKPEVRVYDGEKRLKQGKDYTVSYKNNTKAAQSGDAKPPTVVVKGKGNYSGTETQTFNITKRDIADDCVIKSFTDAYAPLTNGKNPKLVFSAKCSKKALKKNTDYTLTVRDAGGNKTDAYAAEGTYSILIKGVGTNYTGECVVSFDVLNKIPVSKLKVNKIASVEYDGTSKRPQPVVKYGKATLRKGTDYSLYYRNNREMGTATIEITGKGDYFGTRNVTFAITGRQIKKAKFSGFKSSFPYTGDTVYQSGAVLKYGEEELALGTDYTVSYGNHLNKGKATVTYIGLGNYTGTLKKTYNIAAYNIAKDTENRISLSADEISAVYEKGGAKPSVKVYDGTRLLTEGKDYTLSYQNHTAVTTQDTVKQPTITVRGKGNYTGVLTQKKTFTITPKAFAEVTVTAPDVAASPKIGKYKSMPVLTDTNGKKLKVGTDYEKIYTYTYKNTTEKVLNGESEVTRNAGDPVDENDIIPANTILGVGIRAREGGNYIGEKTAEYRIVTSPISKAKITVQNPSRDNKNLFTYTGQEIRIDKSNLTVKVGTDILTDDQYEILEDTYKNNINKGTASVQIRGVGTVYGGTATVKFKIGTKGFQWFWRLFG